MSSGAVVGSLGRSLSRTSRRSSLAGLRCRRWASAISATPETSRTASRSASSCSDDLVDGGPELRGVVDADADLGGLADELAEPRLQHAQLLVGVVARGADPLDRLHLRLERAAGDPVAWRARGGPSIDAGSRLRIVSSSASPRFAISQHSSTPLLHRQADLGHPRAQRARVDRRDERLEAALCRLRRRDVATPRLAERERVDRASRAPWRARAVLTRPLALERRRPRRRWRWQRDDQRRG